MAAEVNAADVVAEVTQAFEHYNCVLDAGDVAAINACFWSSPHTVRFGPSENLFGYDEIAGYRSGQWKAGPPRILERLAVTALGRDFATTSAVFRRSDAPGRSRQSQTWARFPEGWRIIAAHVSVLPG
jgi:hypothetical protein